MRFAGKIWILRNELHIKSHRSLIAAYRALQSFVIVVQIILFAREIASLQTEKHFLVKSVFCEMNQEPSTNP